MLTEDYFAKFVLYFLSLPYINYLKKTGHRLIKKKKNYLNKALYSLQSLH